MKVRKIKKTGKKKVYDITTTTHNFVANDMVVHNSMATPHVSGLLACMKQAHRLLIGKELNTDEVKNMLEQLGEKKNNTRGWGLISWSMYRQWLETEYSTKI